MVRASDALAPVHGPHLTLRLIEPDDAAYVHGLRTDPAYNRHLSQVAGTVEDQRRWIERYKTREAGLQELYYVIDRKGGPRCGLVRLYDIGDESFTWGSWILDHNKPHKAALESAVLVYDIAFELLNLSHAEFDVRRENTGVLAFHRRFGATETHSTDRDTFFIYPRTRFEADRPGYMALLEKVREG